MRKFVVEREIPGAGGWSAEQLQKAARKSNEVLAGLSPRIQWLESYVTGDKLFCVYISPDAETILEHARRSGFPADQVREIKTIIDPSTAG